MKKVKHLTILEFTYDTRKERDDHVKEMESQGWENSGQVSRLKEGVSLHDAHNEDSREWFANFCRYGEFQ